MQHGPNPLWIDSDVFCLSQLQMSRVYSRLCNTKRRLPAYLQTPSIFQLRLRAPLGFKFISLRRVREVTGEPLLSMH